MATGMGCGEIAERQYLSPMQCIPTLHRDSSFAWVLRVICVMCVVPDAYSQSGRPDWARIWRYAAIGNNIIWIRLRPIGVELLIRSVPTKPALRSLEVPRPLDSDLSRLSFRTHVSGSVDEVHYLVGGLCRVNDVESRAMMLSRGQ
jgi:hypothetical protein